MICADRSLRSLLDRYAMERAITARTAKEYGYAINAFERWLKGEPTIDDLASGLSAFVRDRCESKSADGVRSQRGALAAMLRWAADECGMVEMPRKVRPVKMKERVPRAFTHAELSRILSAFRRVRHGVLCIAAIHVAYDAGIRRGDVWRASWADVDGDGILRLIVGKTRRRVMRQLDVSTLEACRDAGRYAGFSATQGRLCPWHRGTSAWRDAWRKALDGAELHIPGAGLQMVRRSSASYVRVAGGDAAQHLGHAPGSRGVAERYYLDPRISETPPALPPRIRP